MIAYLDKKRHTFLYRLLCGCVALTFMLSLVSPGATAYAQTAPVVLNLPTPGSMLPASPAFIPAVIKGLKIHPENPLQFDFIVNAGDTKLSDEEFKWESQKLVKYFLAALTVPEDEMWVNLSPYEKDRIIPEGFGVTEMGRDLLAQDYLLKQLTASLVYPEDDLGKKFWAKVHEKAKALYGNVDIPMDTFNKVWIVPDEAVVWEHEGTAFVVKSRLKVMLEKDYLASEHQSAGAPERRKDVHSGAPVTGDLVATEMLREIVLPEIEREVNEGKTFAGLRQIYNSMILAAWYKNALKETLLGQVYVDRNKTKGIDVEDKEIKQKIYEQYLAAFKKGVYSYIKEDYDPVTRQLIPRKYFSGGFNPKYLGEKVDLALVAGPFDTLRREIQDLIVKRSKANRSVEVVLTEGEGESRLVPAFLRNWRRKDRTMRDLTAFLKAIESGENSVDLSSRAPLKGIIDRLLQAREVLGDSMFSGILSRYENEISSPDSVSPAAAEMGEAWNLAADLADREIEVKKIAELTRFARTLRREADGYQHAPARDVLLGAIADFEYRIMELKIEQGLAPELAKDEVAAMKDARAMARVLARLPVTRAPSQGKYLAELKGKAERLTGLAGQVASGAIAGLEDRVDTFARRERIGTLSVVMEEMSFAFAPVSALNASTSIPVHVDYERGLNPEFGDNIAKQIAELGMRRAIENALRDVSWAGDTVFADDLKITIVDRVKAKERPTVEFNADQNRVLVDSRIDYVTLSRLLPQALKEAKLYNIEGKLTEGLSIDEAARITDRMEDLVERGDSLLALIVYFNTVESRSFASTVALLDSMLRRNLTQYKQLVRLLEQEKALSEERRSARGRLDRAFGAAFTFLKKHPAAVMIPIMVLAAGSAAADVPGHSGADSTASHGDLQLADGGTGGHASFDDLMDGLRDSAVGPATDITFARQNLDHIFNEAGNLSDDLRRSVELVAGFLDDRLDDLEQSRLESGWVEPQAAANQVVMEPGVDDDSAGNLDGAEDLKSVYEQFYPGQQISFERFQEETRWARALDRLGEIRIQVRLFNNGYYPTSMQERLEDIGEGRTALADLRASIADLPDDLTSSFEVQAKKLEDSWDAMGRSSRDQAWRNAQRVIESSKRTQSLETLGALAGFYSSLGPRDNGAEVPEDYFGEFENEVLRQFEIDRERLQETLAGEEQPSAPAESVVVEEEALSVAVPAEVAVAEPMSEAEETSREISGLEQRLGELEGSQRQSDAEITAMQQEVDNLRKQAAGLKRQSRRTPLEKAAEELQASLDSVRVQRERTEIELREARADLQRLKGEVAGLESQEAPPEASPVDVAPEAAAIDPDVEISAPFALEPDGVSMSASREAEIREAMAAALEFEDPAEAVRALVEMGEDISAAVQSGDVSLDLVKEFAAALREKTEERDAWGGDPFLELMKAVESVGNRVKEGEDPPALRAELLEIDQQAPDILADVSSEMWRARYQESREAVEDFLRAEEAAVEIDRVEWEISAGRSDGLTVNRELVGDEEADRLEAEIVQARAAAERPDILEADAEQSEAVSSAVHMDEISRQLDEVADLVAELFNEQVSVPASTLAGPASSESASQPLTVDELGISLEGDPLLEKTPSRAAEIEALAARIKDLETQIAAAKGMQATERERQMGEDVESAAAELPGVDLPIAEIAEGTELLTAEELGISLEGDPLLPKSAGMEDKRKELEAKLADLKARIAMTKAVQASQRKTEQPARQGVTINPDPTEIETPLPFDPDAIRAAVAASPGEVVDIELPAENERQPAAAEDQGLDDPETVSQGGVGEQESQGGGRFKRALQGAKRLLGNAADRVEDFRDDKARMEYYKGRLRDARTEQEARDIPLPDVGPKNLKNANKALQRRVQEIQNGKVKRKGLVGKVAGWIPGVDKVTDSLREHSRDNNLIRICEDNLERAQDAGNLEEAMAVEIPDLDSDKEEQRLRDKKERLINELRSQTGQTFDSDSGSEVTSSPVSLYQDGDALNVSTATFQDFMDVWEAAQAQGRALRISFQDDSGKVVSGEVVEAGKLVPGKFRDSITPSQHIVFIDDATSETSIIARPYRNQREKRNHPHDTWYEVDDLRLKDFLLDVKIVRVWTAVAADGQAAATARTGVARLPASSSSVAPDTSAGRAEDEQPTMSSTPSADTWNPTTATIADLARLVKEERNKRGARVQITFLLSGGVSIPGEGLRMGADIGHVVPQRVKATVVRVRGSDIYVVDEEGRTIKIMGGARGRVLSEIDVQVLVEGQEDAVPKLTTQQPRAEEAVTPAPRTEGEPLGGHLDERAAKLQESLDKEVSDAIDTIRMPEQLARSIDMRGRAAFYRAGETTAALDTLTQFGLDDFRLTGRQFDILVFALLNAPEEVSVRVADILAKFDMDIQPPEVREAYVALVAGETVNGKPTKGLSSGILKILQETRGTKGVSSKETEDTGNQPADAAMIAPQTVNLRNGQSMGIDFKNVPYPVLLYFPDGTKLVLMRSGTHRALKLLEIPSTTSLERFHIFRQLSKLLPDESPRVIAGLVPMLSWDDSTDALAEFSQPFPMGRQRQLSDVFGDGVSRNHLEIIPYVSPVTGVITGVRLKDMNSSNGTNVVVVQSYDEDLVERNLTALRDLFLGEENASRRSEEGLVSFMVERRLILNLDPDLEPQNEGFVRMRRVRDRDEIMVLEEDPSQPPLPAEIWMAALELNKFIRSEARRASTDTEELEIPEGLRRATGSSQDAAMVATELPEQISDVMDELERAKAGSNAEDERIVRARLDRLMSQAAETTRETYARLAAEYTGLRGDVAKGKELEILEKFMALVRKAREINPGEMLHILDVGTGLRDILWLSQQEGVSATGIDVSEPLVKLLKDDPRLNEIAKLFVMDMRKMGFPSNFFDGVHAQASLLHLPLVDEQQGVDLAVQEAKRTLRPRGIYYVGVKAATETQKGFMALDTSEGFGVRFYQFYTPEMLKLLLERNGFEVIGDVVEWTNDRGGKELSVYAKKLVTEGENDTRMAAEEIESRPGETLGEVIGRHRAEDIADGWEVELFGPMPTEVLKAGTVVRVGPGYERMEDAPGEMSVYIGFYKPGIDLSIYRLTVSQDAFTDSPVTVEGESDAVSDSRSAGAAMVGDVVFEALNPKPPMANDDILAIINLMAEVEGFEAWKVERFLAILSEQKGQIHYVARRNGRIIGFVTGGPLENYAETMDLQGPKRDDQRGRQNTFYYHDWMLSPGERGSGIGKELLRQFIQEVRENQKIRFVTRDVAVTDSASIQSGERIVHTFYDEKMGRLYHYVRRSIRDSAIVGENAVTTSAAPEAMSFTFSATGMVPEFSAPDDSAPKDVGGIDFNAALMNLQIKRDGNGVPLPLPQQSIENIHIEGFFPVIINITPANMPLILGAAEGKFPFDDSGLPSDSAKVNPLNPVPARLSERDMYFVRNEG